MEVNQMLQNGEYRLTVASLPVKVIKVKRLLLPCNDITTPRDVFNCSGLKVATHEGTSPCN